MQVSLLALGGGTQATWTEQCKQSLLRAQCIVGAARLLENLPDGCTQRRVAATKRRKFWKRCRGRNVMKPPLSTAGTRDFIRAAGILFRCCKHRIFRMLSVREFPVYN